jgi:hypothetical protein
MPRLKAAVKAAITRKKNKEAREATERKKQDQKLETRTKIKEEETVRRVDPEKELKFRIDEVENEILDVLGSNKRGSVSPEQYGSYMDMNEDQLRDLVTTLKSLRTRLRDKNYKSGAEIGGFLEEFGIKRAEDAMKAKFNFKFKRGGSVNGFLAHTIKKKKGTR